MISKFCKIRKTNQLKVGLKSNPHRPQKFVLFASMKDAFYFILDALFVLKIFKMFLVMWEFGLIKKLRLISKFMTSQPGKQTITIHILPNISRSTDNQTMKFGQFE